MKKLLLILISFALIAAAAEGKRKMEKLYAAFDTSLGKIVCELYPDVAPMTVRNFIGLARGEQPWEDPKTKEIVKRPLYSGTIFHRVIPNFMIQGGDPLGNGTGGPGYKFGDEFSDKVTFDRVGRLAMANAGPATNGSQFFITVAKTPWLNGHHTIFGQVIKGQNVVEKIANAPRGANDRPNTDIVLKSIIISSKKP
ncbi:MAG: peptidylprolyl isomerase [Candidatus Saganbacteria bacterium]|nr:peptidylprolyl isomerase [Candidatus Saganbacteria bacterium]